MARVACGHCGRDLRCQKNEHLLIETEMGIPVRIFECDRWGCNGCASRVLLGIAEKPVWDAARDGQAMASELTQIAGLNYTKVEVAR